MSTGGPPPPSTTTTTATTKLTKQEEDAAAFLRVRNRLADTPDAKLPAVLSKLLPRLVTRFPDSGTTTTGTSARSAGTSPPVVDSNLAGIFETLRERILLNPDGLLKSEWVSSLLKAIVPHQLQESAATSDNDDGAMTDGNKGHNHHHHHQGVGSSWARYKYGLPILEIALVHRNVNCDDDDEASVLTRLFFILEDIHSQGLCLPLPPSSSSRTTTRNSQNNNNDDSENDDDDDDNDDIIMGDAQNNETQSTTTATTTTLHYEDLKESWERISWMIVEQIAKKSSCQPILDWNYLGDYWDDLNSYTNYKKINDNEHSPTDQERSFVTTQQHHHQQQHGGSGSNSIYSLFLDFVTFDPTNNRTYVRGGGSWQRVTSDDTRWQFRRQTHTIQDDFEQVTRQQHAQRELMRRNNDTTRNLLIQQNRRRRDNPTNWNDAEVRYWNALQRCVQSYGVQLFGGRKEDVLRILTGREKPITTAASPYKRPKASQMYKINQRKLSSTRLLEQQKQTRRHSIIVGSALLHLVLGEEHANRALLLQPTGTRTNQSRSPPPPPPAAGAVAGLQHQHQHHHHGLLGTYPFQKGQHPPPLPQPIAQRVFSYLLTAELNLDESNNPQSPQTAKIQGTIMPTAIGNRSGCCDDDDDDDLGIFLHLLKELNNVPSLQIDISTQIYEFIGGRTPPPMCWAIHFLWKVSSSLLQSTPKNNSSSNNNTTKLNTISKHAWDAATELLDCLQDVSLQRFQRERLLASSRGSQDRRIHEHREKQALQSSFVKEALQARSEAYQLLSKYMTEHHVVLASAASANADGTTAKKQKTTISWDVAVRLINCSAFDLSKDTLPALQEACITTLSIYRQAMEKAKAEIHQENISHNPINSMLLPLLKASISASDWSREFVLQWADEILIHLDAGLARVIVVCLSNDEVPAIAERAREALQRLPTSPGHDDDDEASVEEVSMVSFLDLKQPSDKGVVTKDLQDRISAVMESHPSLTPVTAGFVLQEYSYSTHAAKAATDKDLESALSRCGYAQSKSDASTIIIYDDGSDDESYIRHCEVCYEEISKGEGFALHCKHTFCIECWQQGLKATAGAELLSFGCLRHDCSVRASRDDVMRIDPSVIPKLDDAMLEQFIVLGKDYAFCVGVDCTAVACSSSSSSPALVDFGRAVTCNLCSSTFCLQCGSDPHSPATCAVSLKYKTASDRVQAHHDSVEKKTIDCPNCGVKITKNGGCNHMTCSMCGHEFCWICLSANWQDHVCNVFDSLTGVDDLERVQFFRQRVGAQENSCQAAKQQLENFETHARDLLDRNRFSDDNHLLILRQAWETLVASRSYLANTYIAAFGMADMEATIQQEFQTHQSQLQLFTEQLSLLSDNVPTLCQISSERDFQRRFKGIHFCTMAVTGYMQRVDRFMKRRFYDAH